MSQTATNRALGEFFSASACKLEIIPAPRIPKPIAIVVSFRKLGV